MASKKKPTKVIVDARGNVYLRRRTGYHNRLGRIEKTAAGVKACGHTPGGTPYCKNFRSVDRAVLHLVRDWQTWVGVSRGATDY